MSVFLVIGLEPNQYDTTIFESFRQRCFPKGFLVGALFPHTGSVKTWLCRCWLFGDQPGPRLIRNGPFQIVPATMLSQKGVWSDPFSTCWFCSKPMCVDVNFLVTSPGPNQSQTDLFESFRQRCFPKRFLVGAVFHIQALLETYVCRCKLFGDLPGPEPIRNLYC